LTLYAKLANTTRAEGAQLQSESVITTVTFPRLVKPRRARRPAVVAET
jgi:hypothetical protein